MIINILGRRVEIKEVNPSKDKDFINTDHAGVWLPNEGVIKVDASETGREKLDTLIHEIIHAIISESGVSACISDDANEIIAIQGGKVLSALMKIPEEPKKQKGKRK